MPPAPEPRRLSSTGIHGLFQPAVRDELAHAWLAEHAGWFRGEASAPLSRAPENPRVRRLETPLGPVVVKLDRPAGHGRPLARLGPRAPKTTRAFQRARELLQAGLPTPEPLACLVGRDSKGAYGVLLTRLEEGVGPWEFLASATRSPIPSPHPPGETGDAALGHIRTWKNVTETRALLDALATALAGLHREGFRHRDLKAPNILVRGRAPGDLEVLWLDLDGLRRVPARRPSVRVRDLARLAMSFESTAARQVGIRADAWPYLVRRYLETLPRSRPDRR